MSEPADAAVPTLEALQQAGADRWNPARFRYLQAMAQRMQDQPEGVRRALADKLNQALCAYAQQASHLASPPPRQGMGRPARPASPLADLNQYIQQRMAEEVAPPLSHDVDVASDLKSVRRFSEVWSKVAAQEQVTLALGRGPENAGPLNSHMLMLRSLKLMRDLSPEYLRRFLAHMEPLLWLELAGQQNALGDAKTARRPIRGKK